MKPLVFSRRVWLRLSGGYSYFGLWLNDRCWEWVVWTWNLASKGCVLCVVYNFSHFMSPWSVFITLVLVEGLGVLREGLVHGEFPSSPGSCCSCLPTPILCFSALCLVFPTKHCHLVMCELIFLFSCPWNFKSKNVTLMWLFEVAVWAPLKRGLCLSRPAADAGPQVRQIQRLIIPRGAAWCILSVCE